MDVLAWFRVSRRRTQPSADTTDNQARCTPYGDLYTMPLGSKSHGLADEGSYFLANANGQTGIVSSLWPTTLTQINPTVSLLIENRDSTSGGKRIFIDWAHFVVTAAGAAGAALTHSNFAWVIDAGRRYSSGGTELTVTSPNGEVADTERVGRAWFGAITPLAAVSPRFVCTQRLWRPQNSATAMHAVNDHFLMNFGAMEPAFGPATDLTTAKTSAGTWNFNLPPVVIGPGQSALLLCTSPGAAITTGVTMLPEIAWWER